MWGFFYFFFPLFCLIKGQGKAKVCFLFQASWQCCGAEEEAEEELPASFTGLEGQLGSLAGNVSRLWEGARLPPSPSWLDSSMCPGVWRGALAVSRAVSLT